MVKKVSYRFENTWLDPLNFDIINMNKVVI